MKVVPDSDCELLAVQLTDQTPCPVAQAAWRRSSRWVSIACIGATLVVFFMGNFLLTFRRGALEDLLVNQGLVGVHSKPISVRSFAQSGLREMERSTVTILGVAKNVAARLPEVLPQIEALAGMFRSSNAIFVEGDSTDGSRRLFEEWVARSPHNRTLLRSSAAHLTDPIFPTQRLPREGRIALARNLGLAQLRSEAVERSRKLAKVSSLPTGSSEYVIVIDLDIVGFNLFGVMDSFGRPSWDVMCAHGVLLHGLYRDTYAFRKGDIRPNHHYFGDDHSQYNITASELDMQRERYVASKRRIGLLMDLTRYDDEYLASMRPLELDSCFGGLAIYKSEAMRNCSYGFRDEAPPHMLDCEHVQLHRCMRETSRARVFSNPHMKLWYGHSDWAIISAHLSKLFGKVWN